MPQPQSTARWLPGAQRWFGYPEKTFISGQEALSRLTTSAAGFHGYKGQLQPYAGVAAVLGEGRPTPLHRWWITDTPIAEPARGTKLGPGQQYLAEINVLHDDTVVETRTIGAKVGAPWDESIVSNLANSKTTNIFRWGEENNVPADEMSYAVAEFKLRQFNPVGRRG